MKYIGLEFLDLHSELIIIKSTTQDDKLKILNFSSSIITDYYNYNLFFYNISIILKKSTYIEIKTILKKIADANDYTNLQYATLINVIYNILNKPYHHIFYKLKKLYHNELSYFLALHIAYIYHIGGERLEHYYKHITNNYQRQNNYQPKILSEDVLQQQLPDNVMLCDILPNYSYIMVENNLLSTISYIQETYTISTIITSFLTRYPQLAIIKSYQVNLYYFLLLIIRDHELYYDEDFMLFHSYYFFLCYGQLLLPPYHDNSTIEHLITTINIDSHTYLYNLFYCKLNNTTVVNKIYPQVHNITNSSIILRNLFMYPNVSSDLIDMLFINYRPTTLLNVPKFNYRYYDFLNQLVNITDNQLEQLGLYRFNMSLYSLAWRYNSLYRIKKVKKNNSYWLLVNFSLLIYTKNKYDYTPAAQAAALLGEEYKEYSTETLLNKWEHDAQQIFLIYIDHTNTQYGYSIQDILSCNNDNSIFVTPDKQQFDDNILSDLITLLTDCNYSKFTTYIEHIQQLIRNKRNLHSKEFTTAYQQLTISNQSIVDRYFYCYFMLVNYTRFWLGPGYNINSTPITKRSILLLYRERQVQRIIYLLQHYKEQINTIWQDNWDKELYLLADFNTILPFTFQDVIENNVTISYNCSILYDRIMLLASGLFCMAIFTEQHKYIINSIIIYLDLPVNKSNDYITIQHSLQSFSDKTLPLIVQDMLQSNLYSQQLLQPTSDYKIYKSMINYYHLLVENNVTVQELCIPIFIFPSDYKKLDSTMNVKCRDVKRCLKYLNITVENNNEFELFNKPYDYYAVIFEYQSLQQYINNNYKQNIGNILSYYSIYHNTTLEDANNITQYITYVE